MNADPSSVLIINSLYHPRIFGGAERSVQFLAEALVAAGLRVTVATTTPDPEPSMAELNGVAVRYIPVANIYWPFAKNRRASALFHALDICNPAMQRRIAALLDELRPDLLHTNTLVGFSVSAWRAAHARCIPILHTLRDFYLLCPNSKMFRRGRNCENICTVCSAYHLVKRRVSRLVTGVVGNSRFMLDRHTSAGFFGNASLRTVIFNAYHSTSLPRTERTGPLRVGYLGRLDEYKGAGHLLEAVSRMAPEKIEVLLAGDGDEIYLATLRRKHPGQNIQFLGFVPPEQLFAQIDVLAVPSLWHEPLPRGVFEAYAHGVPVIASNRGGLPELVDEGSTGFLFDPDQPDALLSILQRVSADASILPAMRAACVEKAAQFRPESIAASYLAAYRTVAHASKVP